MFRLVPALAVASIALVAAAPALAADYNDGLRGSFTADNYDGTDLGDTLNFELGLRYFYSKGSASFSDIAGATSTNDTAHVLEAHVRVDDLYTRTYLKGLMGYSFAINGENSNPGGTASYTDGMVGYAGGDLGWQPFGDAAGNLRLGFLAGYQYWKETPGGSRGAFTTATSGADIGFDPVTGATSVPMDSAPNDISVSALRLGVSGNARLGPMFDISGEVAAVPYAKISGTLGSGVVPTVYGTPLGNISQVQSSSTDIDGWGYGVMAEAMLGFHPTDNMTVRLGGRAWYMQGWTTATYSAATIGDPSDSDTGNPPAYDTGPSFSNQRYIESDSPWSMFRYGALAELTYNF